MKKSFFKAARYMALNGTNPHIPHKALRHIFNIESGIAGLAIAVTAAAFYTFTGDAKMTSMLATCATAGHLITRWRMHKIHKKTDEIFFGAQHAKLCIDKRPDAFTPPTKAEHIQSAAIIHEHGRKKTMLLAGVCALFPALFATTLNDPNALPVIASLGALVQSEGFSGVMSEFRRARRFGKVADQKWAVRDEPPPLPVTVKNRLPAFGALGRPT